MSSFAMRVVIAGAALSLFANCGSSSSSSDASSGASSGANSGGSGSSQGGSGASSQGGSGAPIGGAAGLGNASGSGEVGPPSCDNIARTALVEPQTNFPGYSAAHVIDGDRSTVQSGTVSWSNYWEPPSIALPQWFDLDFGEKRTIRRVELYTSDGFALADYDVSWWDGDRWQTILSITGNTETHRSHEFPAVSTSRLRILGRRGPENQTFYVRLNELEVYGGTTAQCPGGSGGELAPDRPGIARTRSDSQVTASTFPCDPNDLTWSCQSLDRVVKPNCSYQNFQGSRVFDTPPPQLFGDARLWPGNVLSSVAADGATFTPWQVDRAPMGFTLTYAASHDSEAGSMTAASAANFQKEVDRILTLRRTVAIPAVVELEIDPIGDGEQLELLTGYSSASEPFMSSILNLDFGASAGQTEALVMLTFRNYDVSVALPSSLSAVLTGGASDPALANAPSAPALVEQVTFGTRLFLLAAGSGSFDDFADFLAKVVNHVLSGTEATLSSAETQRLAASHLIAMELRNSLETPLTGTSDLKTFFTGFSTYSALNPGDPIAYRLIDFGGRTLPRTITARYVNATCVK